MLRISIPGYAIAACSLSLNFASARPFVPPPEPPGYDDPGPEPAEPLRQIIAKLKETLKDPYSIQQFSMCESRIEPAFPPYSPDSSWKRAERVTLFLLNAKNSYGGFTGLQEGIATFVDGKLTDVSLSILSSETDTNQEKMAEGRGTCRPMKDEDISRLIH